MGWKVILNFDHGVSQCQTQQHYKRKCFNWFQMEYNVELREVIPLDASLIKDMFTRSAFSAFKLWYGVVVL